MPTEQSPSRQTTAAQATDSGSRRDLPPRWSLPVTWVHNGALGAAVLTLFAPWLWTGALLLTWSPVLVLLVLVGWLLQPRQLMRGLWSVIALVLLAWPWLLTAWQARAPDVTDAARARPVVAVDGLAGADLPGPDQEGSDARLVAALLGVRLAVDDEAGERQLRGLPGIADWKEVLPRLQPAGGAVEPAYRYVILSRVRLDSWRTELLPDSGGAIYRTTMHLPDGRVELVVAALPPVDTPIGFRHQHRALEVLRERLAAVDGPLIVLLPRGISWGSWRWHGLHAAGLRLPSGPPPRRSWFLQDARVRLLVRDLAAVAPAAGRELGVGGRDRQAALVQVLPGAEPEAP